MSISVLDMEIRRKRDYAKEKFPSVNKITNELVARETLNEILEQIRVCEELGVHLDETEIKELCTGTSANNVCIKAHRIKKRYA